MPVDFEDRETLEDLLSEQKAGEGARATRVHILVPQRGDKRSLIDLAGNNAKQSYDQRFRVLKPNAQKIQEELQEVLSLPELPKRIECFDISHIQGAETVASMVVWEDGKMKKSDYRKFIIRTVEGVDDFASMREVVTRRYKRLQEEKKPMPSLVLIDGGLGSCTLPRRRWTRWRSSTSRWPPSPSAKRFCTSTGRRRIRLRSTITRRCCT